MSGILKALNNRFLTRSCNIKNLAFTAISTKFYHNNNVKDDNIMEPYDHILTHIDMIELPKIYEVFNYWLNIPQEKIKVIADLINSINVGFSLIDDACDETLLRDAVPTAHRIYGKQVTICNALDVLIQASEKSKQIHSDASGIYIEEMLKVFRTQGLLLYYREILKCPAQEEYEIMLMYANGAIYVMAVRIMQLLSENKADFTKLLLKFGLYTQILDDYLDCKGSKENNNFAPDITEGKFTYPIIHAINNHPEDKTLKYILSKRTNDRIIKQHFINALERYDSFEYCRQKLRIALDDIKEELKNFEDNPKMNEYLSHLYKLHENW